MPVAQLTTDKLAKVCEQTFDLNRLKLSEEYYYDSLPLCVIDAVFSINVRYQSVKNTVDRYCRKFNLRKYNPDPDNQGDRHTIQHLIDNLKKEGFTYGVDTIFQNRQRTSSKGGILKAEAVYLFASALLDAGVLTLNDFRINGLPVRTQEEIFRIPGQKSGLSLRYFCMLAGEDTCSKPDRHILRFLSEHTAKQYSMDEAQQLLAGTVALLKYDYPELTVRLLDYNIWSLMSRGKNSGKTSISFVISSLMP